MSGTTWVKRWIYPSFTKVPSYTWSTTQTARGPQHRYRDAPTAELRRRYKVAWYNVQGQLTAIGQLVAEDFPAPDDAGAVVTRYDVDAMNALAGELGRLCVGNEKPA